MMHTERAELLGLSFDTVTMESAVARCLEMCRAPRASHLVVTANASHLCMMRRDPELARACRAGQLIVADGMSVVWALRAAGQPVPERVAGVELMAHLLAAAGEHRLRVYFLGAKREVVSRLVELSRAHYPGIEIAGFCDGYFGPEDHLDIVEEIRASGAHMLFVGMPTPFKETWCERHRHRLEVPVIMGVGGSFDVLAGFIRRAPRWVQSLGLEWFWRLLMEPRKLWKRYLITNWEFIWLAGLEVVARRLGRAPASLPSSTSTDPSASSATGSWPTSPGSRRARSRTSTPLPGAFSPRTRFLLALRGGVANRRVADDPNYRGPERRKDYIARQQAVVTP